MAFVDRKKLIRSLKTPPACGEYLLKAYRDIRVKKDNSKNQETSQVKEASY